MSVPLRLGFALVAGAIVFTRLHPGEQPRPKTSPIDRVPALLRAAGYLQVATERRSWGGGRALGQSTVVAHDPACRGEIRVAQVDRMTAYGAAAAPSPGAGRSFIYGTIVDPRPSRVRVMLEAARIEAGYFVGLSRFKPHYKMVIVSGPTRCLPPRSAAWPSLWDGG